MKKFFYFALLFPIIFLILFYSLGFIDHALNLGICRNLFFDVFYTKKFVHYPSPLKNCFARQRVLSGALEMYNMDNTKMMTTLDVEELIRGGYLKLKDIEDYRKKCVFHSDGDLTDSGTIYCEYHGNELNTHKPSPEYYKEQQRKNSYESFRVLTQWGLFLLIVGTITFLILK